MSVNKHQDHVYVLPEDDANRQLAVGFVNHIAVCSRCIQIINPLRGWPHVRDGLLDDYIPLLRKSPQCHIVLLVDFDQCDTRRDAVLAGLPPELSNRVFVFGVWSEPEDLRADLRKGHAAIGHAIADDCKHDTSEVLAHELLRHNQPEVQRMVEKLKRFVFDVKV